MTALLNVKFFMANTIEFLGTGENNVSNTEKIQSGIEEKLFCKGIM